MSRVLPLISTDITLSIPCLSLERTLDCGQAFRWRVLADGSWEGVVRGKVLRLSQKGDTITFHHTTPQDMALYWNDYFDLHRDYQAIDWLLCRDERLRMAADDARGIRILRQEPWEALCTFILSQNNNIPRIKGIVERLCRDLGEDLGQGYFAFPTPERLAACQPEDLAGARCGFRTKYLLDAARRVADGEIDLAALYTLPIDEARERLKSLYGVGVKVAECALLYGFGRLECFPMDVWMKRVMAALFPGGLPSEFAPIAGIAQQYLFHYGRIHKIK